MKTKTGSGESFEIALYPAEAAGNCNPLWYNFVYDVVYGNYPGYDILGGINVLHNFLLDRYNGRVISDTIVFDTEQDKMWFVLNCSA
jgi:hypothetical protein